MVAPTENVEAALNLLERAERPLVILGKGMAWSRAEDEVRAFVERTQVPFVRSPMGKGVMPDDHPLSAGAARTLALQQADVIFLMGARFNWIFHFGLPPRYAKDVKIVQLDIAPEEIGHNKATEVALVGDGKAIVSQLNKALDKRQWGREVLGDLSDLDRVVKTHRVHRVIVAPGRNAEMLSLPGECDEPMMP